MDPGQIRSGLLLNGTGDGLLSTQDCCGTACTSGYLLLIPVEAEGDAHVWPVSVAVRALPVVRTTVPTGVTVIANPVVWIAVPPAVIAETGISIVRIPVTASPIAAAIPITCAICKARVAFPGTRKLVSAFSDGSQKFECLTRSCGRYHAESSNSNCLCAAGDDEMPYDHDCSSGDFNS